MVSAGEGLGWCFVDTKAVGLGSVRMGIRTTAEKLALSLHKSMLYDTLNLSDNHCSSQIYTSRLQCVSF